MITSKEQKILDTDFPNGKIEKNRALLFAKLQRGSVRLINGLFRTEDEQEEFIRSGLKKKLPGY